MTSFVPLTFLPDGVSLSGARWFVVRSGKVLVTEESHDHLDVPCFASDGDGTDEDGAELDLFSLFARLPETEWFIAGRAVQIVDWARTHRFCGRCGTATVHNDIDRAMKCPSCGLLAFPRLAPAIITLVRKGEQALLARGVNFRGPMYSALAGFVEPGENLEQAVVREVREEVGIEVGNVRYVSSQPWPFPHSLMLGFEADWVSGEIEIDPKEILDAGWYSRDSIPNIPPGISIARKLIDRWLLADD
jgi:NAD+ diphosphatase